MRNLIRATCTPHEGRHDRTSSGSLLLSPVPPSPPDRGAVKARASAASEPCLHAKGQGQQLEYLNSVSIWSRNICMQRCARMRARVLNFMKHPTNLVWLLAGYRASWLAGQLANWQIACGQAGQVRASPGKSGQIRASPGKSGQVRPSPPKRTQIS